MPVPVGRVLVVEDEAPLRAVLSDVLSASGYEADVAEDGASGLALFRQHRYGAVIADVLVPGMSGLDVAAAFREADPDVRLILLTGASNVTPTHAHGVGGTLLYEPATIDVLMAAIETACAV